MLKRVGTIFIVFTSIFLGALPIIQGQGPSYNISSIPFVAAESQNEDVYVDINPEGDIFTHFYFQNSELLPNIEGVSDYLSSYIPQMNSIAWIDWNIQYNSSEEEENSWIQFYFFTTDSNLAQEYAQWFMDIIMTFEVDDYSYSNSWGWNHWDGYTEQERYVTGVQYNAHIDWDGLKDSVESKIDRTNGGISAQVDLSEIDLVMMNWDFGGESISQRLGVRWHEEVEHLNGAHQFSLDSLLHVSSLEKQNGIDANTHVSFSLPNISNLWSNPSENIDFYSYVGEDWKSEWDRNDWAGLNFNLDNSRPSMDDFIVGFDYDFTPWDIVPQESAWIDVNEYGYMKKNMEIRDINTTLHEYWPQSVLVDPHFNNLHVSYYPKAENWDNPHFTIRVNYDLNLLEDAIPLSNYFEDQGYFDDNINDWINWTTHETENLDLFNWIKSNLGWENVSNFNEMKEWGWSWWHHDWDRNLAIPMRSYELKFNHTYDQNTWDALWINSDIYQKSGMMQKSSLIDASSIQENARFHTEKGGYQSSDLYIEWNPLHPDILNPQKAFTDTVSDSHNFDFANLFGWTDITPSAGFYQTHLSISFPANSPEDRIYLTSPGENGGYGFHTWDGNGQGWYDYWRQDVGMNMYCEAPWYGSDSYPIYFDSFEGNFNYRFHEDTDDIIPPRIDDIGYYDGTYRWWDTSSTHANSTRLIVSAMDADDNHYGQWWSYYAYNTTNHEWYPRFSNSYVDSVNLSFEYQDFKDMGIDESDFPWGPYSMENLTLSGTWSYNLDTNAENLPDGNYIVHVTALDSVGNTGYRVWDDFDNDGVEDYFQIDNYNDSLFTIVPELTFNTSMPENNSKIEGIIPIGINVTDDIGIFAVTVQIGQNQNEGYGYILEESSTPDIYNFDWDSTINNFQENEAYWITVCAWDMEGHKSYLYYNLSVDNQKAGDPPTIELISPLIVGGDVPVLEDVVLFEANITDDNFPPLAVKFQIDDRTSFDMIFNETSGFYYYEYDVSTLFNGTHTLTITVTDNDDPREGTGQHIRSETFEFFANTTISEFEKTNPPIWRNALPGNFTSAEDIISDSFEIKIDVFDDQGIEAVNLKVYQILGYNLSAIPDSYSNVDLTNIQIIKDVNIPETEENNGWHTYTYQAQHRAGTSSFFFTVDDGLILVELEIGDTGPIQNKVKVYMILFINISSNADFNNNPFGEIPGFSMEFLMIALSLTVIALAKKTRRHA
ncbi:hypothetical protein NEF87_004677 [Candidatus Lokiarchaeum ossiferum]|uniref:Cadherin domain-containing protein n=1 Tax=Candidatus Lokiarchaeum ossiferum TaxID=2951803 RepID=A0ABY6HXZ3_9ARCH|nr:hypothetical protein NEF87_004677 [Candidatus Lokiarchaeum sp. B-35]